VYQCEVTAVDDYREKVFQLIPQLDWLDSTDRYSVVVASL
jgi:hypothetical protein